MVKPITLFTASAGLNIRVDPQRLMAGYDNETGVSEFSQCVNFSIDDRGLPSLRNGGELVQAGNFSSVFCDGGDCFAVQERESDAAILQILTISPFTTATVATGLTKGKRMAWGQTGEDTFYSNTVQKGYIRAGVRYDWPVHTYQGPEADMQFATAIPAASEIAFLHGGKVLLAVGNAVFQNHAPFQYGLFHPARGNVATFDSPVTMLASVEGGFYASDERNTWFFRALEGWYLYKQERAENAPVLTGSLAHDQVDLSKTVSEDVKGFGRVWASTKGLCVGDGQGRVTNNTFEKVVYPDGYTSGACLVKDTTIIHTAS